ncbi:PH domain-containing protein [Hyphococcus luteus]|uniref:YdbS-like PH domain-containing protein n=1 Tax=Hyphococcus luteus TaxID=2058213 RepID=A0A2S7JZF6_9PROT|nr:PH domain-containing protein [Marinicaulis flavus]PQA85578.1 hypothetical protein CW354_21820 [Marinicaulis flavus]
MGYVKRTLAPGEDYLYRAHFNWTYDFRSWVWLVFSAIPTGLWLYALRMDALRHDFLSESLAYLSGASLTLGAVLCLSRFVRKWTTVIAVTSVRLILKTGMIARASHEVMLDEIEEVLVKQSFLGRILGYGVLRVRGTGDSTVEFPVVGSPTKVRKEIEAAIMRARGAAKAA